MKPTAVSFLIISVLALSVLGFLAMNHDGEHGASGCLVLAARGAECLKLMNRLELASLHLATLKSFSTALIQLAAALSIFLTFVFIWRRRLLDFYVLGRSGFHTVRGAFKDNLNPQELKIIHWLAIHELSPSYF